MPDGKLASRGSVANIINNLHKLEYESGRLDQPTPPKPRNALTSDHPAQKPRADRPVPFHERPMLRHYTPEPSEPSRTNHIVELLDLRRHEIGEKQKEKANPFRRRDSTASSVSPTPPPPPQHRESISHRAFERVRATSPPLAMPLPRVEISSWHESAEQYITRMLTERWSPPHPHAVGGGSVRGNREEREGGVEREHVDAPLVQEVLGYIDRILVEHTGTLRSVVEESRRVLREKEVLCLDDDPAHDHDHDHRPNGHGEDDWRSCSSSVPELIEVVDRTAEKMGLELPRYDISQTSSQGLVRALSPTSPRQRVDPELESQTHHRGWEEGGQYTSAQNVHALPSRELPLKYDHGLNPAYEVSHHSHSSRPSEQSHYSDQARPSPWTTQQRRSRPELPSKDSTLSYHEDQPTGHNHPNNPTLSPSREPLTYRPHISPSPSPAFLEYDRIAALADRASRNSITDLIDTAAMRGDRAESVQAEARSSGVLTRRQSHADESGRNMSVAEGKGKKLGDSWMQRSTDASTKWKLKREGTMDRLQAKGEYESRVRKRFKPPDPSSVSAEKEIKPIAKTGKRGTERMMDSIMTSQEREGSSSRRKK